MSPIRNTRANKSKAIVTSSSDRVNPTKEAVNEPRSQHEFDYDRTYSDLMEQFYFSVIDKWRKKVDAEVQKREVLEARLKELQDMCEFYAQRGLKLEEALKECEEEEGSNAPVAAACRVEEEVDSKFNPSECDALCRVCKNQKANIVCVPCRHLSVCMSCDSHVSRCPICPYVSLTKP